MRIRTWFQARREAARREHYAKRNELAADIRKDIDNIGCIYPSIGAAMYDEPRDRLSQRISHRILGDWPGDNVKAKANR